MLLTDCELSAEPDLDCGTWRFSVDIVLYFYLNIFSQWIAKISFHSTITARMSLTHCVIVPTFIVNRVLLLLLPLSVLA